MVPGRSPTVLLLMAVVCAVGACPAENWTGKSPALRQLDGINLLYREYEANKGAPGEYIAYSLTLGSNVDRVSISALPTRGEWAWDDGWPPDRFPADNEHTGLYRVAERRGDTHWFFKTRPGIQGEPVKTMPPEQERSHPYANRANMAGGAGGAVDNASICPPGYVMTGLRTRLDLTQKTVAQLATVCRALPRREGRTPTHQVEGSWWGEELKTPVQTLECPPGSAVIPDAQVSTGPWGPYTVINGFTLRCASMLDPGRATTAELTVGFPTNPVLRATCREEGQADPPPLAVGMRVIAGQRLDALGFICDVGPSQQAQPVDTVRFFASPSSPVDLVAPLAQPDAAAPGPVYAQLHVLNRQATLDHGVLELPLADASLVWRPRTTTALTVVAPLEGCVVAASATEVVLAHGGQDPCSGVTGAQVVVTLRGGAFTAAAGQKVQARTALGSLPEKDAALTLRVLGAAVARDHGLLDGPAPVTPFSSIQGEGTRLLVRHAPPPPPPVPAPTQEPPPP